MSFGVERGVRLSTPPNGIKQIKSVRTDVFGPQTRGAMSGDALFFKITYIDPGKRSFDHNSTRTSVTRPAGGVFLAHS